MKFDQVALETATTAPWGGIRDLGRFMDAEPCGSLEQPAKRSYSSREHEL